MLFNMGVAMTAEFTAVGDMFAIVIGSIRWPIVVIIGIVSAAYTAYGGLYVSIITDQVICWSCRAFIALIGFSACLRAKTLIVVAAHKWHL